MQVTVGPQHLALGQIRQSKGVNVAAAEDHSGFAVRLNTVIQQGCKARCAAWLDDQLCSFQQQKDGGRNGGVGNGDNVVGVLLNVSKRARRRRFDRDAVADGSDGNGARNQMPGMKRLHGGVTAIRLDADDADVGAGFLKGKRDARKQAAAADGDDHRIYVGNVLQQL